MFNDNKLARVITKYPPHYVILESDDVDEISSIHNVLWSIISIYFLSIVWLTNLVNVYEEVYESFDKSMVELQNHGYNIENWNEYIFYNPEEKVYQFVADDK